jgi:hypothetical protein
LEISTPSTAPELELTELVELQVEVGAGQNDKEG